MKECIERFYQKRVVIQICKQFCYNNIHEIPRLQKIVINRRLGNSALNTMKVEFEITKITRQCGIITQTHISIAGFKIRKKIPIGLIITLRYIYVY